MGDGRGKEDGWGEGLSLMRGERDRLSLIIGGESGTALPPPLLPSQSGTMAK